MSKRPILVVEDDADIRESLCDVLVEEGYEVHTAADGAQALAVLSALETPPLVLLDLLMPVMNGWEMLAQLQARGSKAPVIVLSAAADASKVMQSGATGFLSKPVHVAELLETVQAHCSVP